MRQVTVTIGRNIGSTFPGDGELSDSEWADFQARVRLALETTVKPELGVSVFHGEGEWDGVKEENALFLALDTVDEVNRFALLRGELLKIAYKYRQDAIALGVNGNSELVEFDGTVRL